MNSSKTMSPVTTIEELPIGCRIENIRQGRGKSFQNFLYADLVGPDDGVIIISCRIDNIVRKLKSAVFIPNEQFIIKYRWFFLQSPLTAPNISTMKLQLTYSELCEILSKNWGATVDSVEIVDKTKENQKNSKETLAIVREFPKAHNPGNLTPEQYGFAEGYRLLGEDEIKNRSLCHFGIELWEGSWSTIGYAGSNTNSTYRTKLSREELAKLI